MEAMTLEQERKAFEDWLTDCDTNPQAPPRDNRGNYLESDVRDMWRVWQARAHLAQPAQAVDVGEGWNALLAEAKRLFLRQMAERQPGIDWSDRFHKLTADTRLEWVMQAADRLMPTRALSGEKAGPVGDEDMALIPRHYASNIQVAACMMEQSGNVLDRREAPVLRKIAALLTASPTPDKEGK